MESATRRLLQQRAILTAQQGDPQLPASCTLLAKRNRLRAELDQADIERAEIRAYNAENHCEAVASARPAAAIERDIRRVQDEIEMVQRKIASIDSVIAREESSRAEHAAAVLSAITD